MNSLCTCPFLLSVSILNVEEKPPPPCEDMVVAAARRESADVTAESSFGIVVVEGQLRLVGETVMSQR